jgi:chromosome partitioning protein
LDDAHPVPERQYATADALGSRADADARIFSTGLPEVRMSTSNDPPSTDTETPAISVSVTRPWLEIDPAPAFREAQRREAEASVAPAQALPSTISPLIESISLMDDSTPLALEVAEDTRRRIALAGRRFPRPKNTRVITVSNQKGGVGKTTTTVNMAAALAQAGLRVLVLDIDPQGNASTALGIDHHAEVPSVYDVLVEGRPLDEVIQQCPDIENLWCAPATIDLAGAEIELVSLVARESRLEKAVSSYLAAQDKGEDRLDYILIDCPPSLGLLTVNAFVAAHEVLIPIQCEYYALEGLSQLLRNVELIRGHLNTALHVSTILLTMYDGRTRLSSQVADEVRSHFPSEVLKTTVPRSVRISEAPSHGQTVMTYDPASSGALSYLEAARELAEQVLSAGDDALPTEDRA